MKKLRVLLADDHSLIRQGVRSVINERPDWEVCGEAHDGRTAVELARQLSPDIVILDFTMPGLNGVDAIRLIKAGSPGTRVLVLTMHDSEALAEEVLEAGGYGFLLKSDAPESLPQAIETIASGRHYLTTTFSMAPGDVSTDLKQPASKSPAVRSRLTPREREILQWLAVGKSNKQVAETLQISPGTVETHRKNILGKLNAHSTAELVLYAVRNNLIQP